MGIKPKREIYIAFSIGIIMILICIFLFYIGKKDNFNINDIKVYRLYSYEDNEDNHYYKECELSTEDRINISDDLKHSLKISKSSLTGVSITGNYKIVIGDDFIAFDNDSDNYFYNGNQNKIYSFESSIYNQVIDYCE